MNNQIKCAMVAVNRKERPAETWLPLGAQIVKTVLEQQGCRFYEVDGAGGYPVRGLDILFLTFYFCRQFYSLPGFLKDNGIPYFTSQRDERYPLIIAGGQGVDNPEPIADFIDIFVIGDGEEVVRDLVKLYSYYNTKGKNYFLNEAAKIPGIYVPHLYKVEYDDRGKVAEWRPVNGAPETIEKQSARDISTSLKRELRTNNRTRMVEIARGCRNWCRFCLLGWTGKPYRENPGEVIMEALEAETRRVNLFAPDEANHKDYWVLAQYLESRGLAESGQNMRIDNFRYEIPSKTKQFSFGIEGLSEGLRDMVGKAIKDEKIVEVSKFLADCGIRNIKYYLILGLPTETKEDVDIFYSQVLLPLERAVKNHDFTLRITSTCLLPTPHTPMQYLGHHYPHQTVDYWYKLYCGERRRYKMRFVACNTPTGYFLDSMALKGNRQLAKFFIALEDNKKYFVANKSFYSLSNLKALLELLGIRWDIMLGELDPKEVLYWDFIEMPIKKGVLTKIYERMQG